MQNKCTFSAYEASAKSKHTSGAKLVILNEVWKNSTKTSAYVVH